jgi:outer membrane protein assembly factor BamB
VPSVPARVTGPPIVLHDLLVAPDGMVVQHIEGATPYDIAVPSGPHSFTVRGLIVDTITGQTVNAVEPAAFEDRKLTRRDADGRARWVGAVEDAPSVRPPDVAISSDRVVAAHDGVVQAYDDKKGTSVWTARIPGDRLHVAGDTVYSVMCTQSEHSLIGLALADGKERFRSDIAIGCDPTLQIVNDLVIVSDESHHQTRIFDRAGHQRAELSEVVQGDGLALGSTTILVTDIRVVALDPDANLLWQRKQDSFVGRARIAELPGGDFVLASYGAISDSGVDVMRLRRDGSEVWHSCAAPLGVGHSEYEHFAYLEVRGDALLVASEGSYGAFLEQLAVRTGTREKRCVYEAEQGVENGCAPIRKPCR